MRIFCCSNTAGGGGTERLKVFQSAMRIFCCSNASVDQASPQYSRVSIRDADFLLFERDRDAAIKAEKELFQSAMRIFCCSNIDGLEARCHNERVSIRDADFLLFEQILMSSFKRLKRKFQSAMRIFCCSNRRGSTNKQGECEMVSIRDADFLLFERGRANNSAVIVRCFNPRCGFFAVRTAFLSYSHNG